MKIRKLALIGFCGCGVVVDRVAGAPQDQPPVPATVGAAPALLATAPQGQAAADTLVPTLHVVYGQNREILDSRFPRWLAPEEVERLEARIDLNWRAPTIKVEVGERAWSFCPADEPGLLLLPLTPAVRQMWNFEGTLAVRCQWGDSVPMLLASLRAIPRKLDLQNRAAAIRIRQRETAEIPGSRGFLFVTSGDITGGQVRLSVTNTLKEVVIEPESRRLSDALVLNLADEGYVIVVEQFELHLVHDDYAQLTIWPQSVYERHGIERLLGAIENAHVTFIRDGTEYSGAEAARHLRRKLDPLRDDVRTVDEFIEHVASRSSLTGKPYHIKLEDGSVVEAEPWLREQQAILVPRPRSELPVAPTAPLPGR